MIRSSIKRLASEALRVALEERDASRICVYTAPWVMGSEGPIRDGAVVLDNYGQILAIGPAAEIRRSFSWARRADMSGILMPGLINAHARLEIGETERLPEGLSVGADSPDRGATIVHPMVAFLAANKTGFRWLTF